MPTEIIYGPWCPTSYLRWNNGKLEQKMRRKVKKFPEKGSAWRAGYDYEWQQLPELKCP